LPIERGAEEKVIWLELLGLVPDHGFEFILQAGLEDALVLIVVIVALGCFVVNHDPDPGIVWRHHAGAGLPVDIGRAIDAVAVQRINIVRVIIADGRAIERQLLHEPRLLVLCIKIEFGRLDEGQGLVPV